jgi:hypothetical protein
MARPSGHWLRDRSAVVVLVALWLAFLLVQLITGTYEATQDALHHGESFDWSDYLMDWTNKVFENNASEMLQVAVAAVVFKHLLFVGSPESRESSDEMQDDVKAIRRMLEER